MGPFCLSVIDRLMGDRCCVLYLCVCLPLSSSGTPLGLVGARHRRNIKTTDPMHGHINPDTVGAIGIGQTS
jgi:hypothetical protein